MDTLNYATYFDQHYLLRGLALYRSLSRHSPPFTLWVLCLDEATFETLRQLGQPSLEPISLAELERRDPELAGVRDTRNRYEYYWTCGPAFLLNLFESQPTIDVLTYFDADLYFFGDPEPIFEGLGASSLLVVESRRIGKLASLTEQRGRYNVAVNAFRRRPQALACLRRWREQCIEWCYHRVEPNRWADQKYLDEWPALYDELVVLDHLGVDLATWNVGNYTYRYDQGRTWVDNDPLVAYHFNRLRIITPWLYDPGAYVHRQRIDPLIRRYVYLPYVRELRAARRQVECFQRPIPSRDALKYDYSKLRLVARMLRHRSFLVVTDSFAL